jgi:hypothetical protein
LTPNQPSIGETPRVGNWFVANNKPATAETAAGSPSHELCFERFAV